SRELGDRRGQYLSRHYLGVVAEHEGDLELARSIYEECLPVWRELRFQVQLAWTLHGIGYVAYRQGGFPAARSPLGPRARACPGVSGCSGRWSTPEGCS